MLLSYLKKIDRTIRYHYKIQDFNPRLYSILINPFFIIRMGLHNAIKSKAKSISGRVLDFGCGSKPYKHLFEKSTDYVGVDIVNDGHSHENENIEIFYDGNTLPFPDNYFDAVFSSEVLEHVFNIQDILKEINRVLKPGGKVLFTTPFVWEEHEIPNDFARYSSFGMEFLCETHGFKIIEKEKVSNFIGVVAQLIALYIRQNCYTRFFYLNLLINTVLIFPFIAFGYILSIILPKNSNLYLNVLILGKKTTKN